MELIELTNDGKGLGFGIIGGRSTGVMVKTILPGGAAGQVNTAQVKKPHPKEPSKSLEQHFLTLAEDLNEKIIKNNV